MLFFGYLAYCSYQDKDVGWPIIWLASAILVNPIFKIALGREIWNVIDVFWAILLVCSVVWNRDKSSAN